MKAVTGIETVLSAPFELGLKKDDALSKNRVVDAPYSVSQSKILTEADYRLVIERNPNTGSYIYKTLNAITGEVVSQRPAEAVLKMGDSQNYVPGSMVSSKV